MVIIPYIRTVLPFGCQTGSQLQGERFYNHNYISIPFMVIMSLTNDRTMYGIKSFTVQLAASALKHALHNFELVRISELLQRVYFDLPNPLQG